MKFEDCFLCKKPMVEGDTVGGFTFKDKQGKQGQSIGHLLCILAAKKILAEESDGSA